ncbi:MAG: hypothetical protein RIF41_29980 [Polyangiaceae bacterium]
MPLYLVRWPTLVASIVRADDEDHLTDILDEVSSPGDAVWTEYRGPLWVDVPLGIKARFEDDDWSLEGMEQAAKDPLLGAKLDSESSDTSSEMFDAILGTAFPHLFKLIEAQLDGEGPNADDVRHAAMLDLWVHRGSGELPGWLKKMFKRRGNGAPES